MMPEQGFFSLAGQIAVVTGGGQGIGEGIAKRLHSAGARIAILDLNADNAKKVAQSLGGLGVKCDVSSADSVKQAIAAVQRELGDITILVNNAGISGKAAYIWELDEKEIDSVYAINLRSVFLTCRAVVEKMLEKRYRGEARTLLAEGFASVMQRALEKAANEVKLMVSTLGPDAAALGAARFAAARSIVSVP
jgi:NAD(P)-dependent dehydrogenase (short-subunit alcohol dehydrogenase family)